MKGHAARVALGEGEDVGDRCAAERVDRLRVVADHQEVSVAAEHGVDHVGLEVVGVLVLVDQDVAEAGGEVGADVRVLAQQQQPVEQQVVVVHQVAGALALEVAAEHRLGEVCGLDELRGALGEHLVERAPGVDHHRVHGQQHGGAGEPGAGCRGHHVGQCGAHQVGGVLAVEDAVAAGVTEPVAEAAQQAIADRVERAAHDPDRVAA